MKIKAYSQPSIQYWITADGQYYAGGRINPDDTEVPARPDHTYDEWDGEKWVQNPAMKADIDAAEAVVMARAADLADSLPSWAEIDAAITAATTITALKVIVRKMARVLYWMAKNQAA